MVHKKWNIHVHTLRRLSNWTVSETSIIAVKNGQIEHLCPVFESRGNPGVTRESRVTPGLRENSVFKPSNPGVNSG